VHSIVVVVAMVMGDCGCRRLAWWLARWLDQRS